MDGKNHIDTDELSFVINNINEMNIELYKKIYSISAEQRHSFIDGRVTALMSVANNYTPSFISLHINTIFLEYIRTELMNKGIVLETDISLIEAMSVYDAIEEISNSEDLVSCLQSGTSDDCELFSLGVMLDIDLSRLIIFISSYREYIRKLYTDNMEFIYREYNDPISVPSVL